MRCQLQRGLARRGWVRQRLGLTLHNEDNVLKIVNPHLFQPFSLCVRYSRESIPLAHITQPVRDTCSEREVRTFTWTLTLLNTRSELRHPRELSRDKRR